MLTKKKAVFPQVWLHWWLKGGPEGKDSFSGDRCHPHGDNLCLHNHSRDLYSHYEPAGKNSSTIPLSRMLPCQFSVKLRPFFYSKFFYWDFFPYNPSQKEKTPNCSQWLSKTLLEWPNSPGKGWRQKMIPRIYFPSLGGWSRPNLWQTRTGNSISRRRGLWGNTTWCQGGPKSLDAEEWWERGKGKSGWQWEKGGIWCHLPTPRGSLNY